MAFDWFGLFFCSVCLAQAGGSLNFLAIGDWGEDIIGNQVAVAATMAKWAERSHPHFIVSVGDNFYPWGAFTPDDPQFDWKWREMYNQPSLRNLTWYISLGNHDYKLDNEWNQVEFGKKEPRWYLPHLWYSFYRTVDGATVHFVVIDTAAIRENKNDPGKQLIWLEEELKNSKADWKLVIGHRFIYSAGYYGPTTGVLDREVRPLLEKYAVDFYICGHDHNLQHMRSENGTGTEYVLTGGGGAILWEPKPENKEKLKRLGMDAPLVEYDWGFVSMTIERKRILVDYVNDAGKVIHSFVKTGGKT